MSKCLSSLSQIWRSHLLKTICLASVICAFFEFIRSRLGHQQDFLLSVILGMTAAAISGWLLMDKESREIHWLKAKIAISQNLHRTAKMVVMVTALGLTAVTRQDPTVPFVQQVLMLVSIVGFIMVLAAPIVIFLMRSPFSHPWSSFDLLQSWIQGLTTYSIALWLIGAHGDIIYQWVVANPEDSAILVTSSLIGWGIFKASAGPTNTHPASFADSANWGVADAPRRSTTQQDDRYTAAHESGHALVYAALGSLPPYVKMVINDPTDDSNALGFITGINRQFRVEEKTFAEWYMLMLLAGKKGESALYGESTIGCSNDHSRWVNVAHTYLSNHYFGIYYPEPHNKIEQEHNEAKLEALQAKQLSTLDELFSQNIETHIQLAGELLEHRTMDRENITPILSQVKLPADFPLPYGPFDQFSTDWPDDR